jgi:hypothetical protein
LSPTRITKQTLLRYRYRMEQWLEVRCARCGEAFLAQRITARYCSNACRQLAYLDRHAPPGVGGPLTMADLEALRWRLTPPNPD